MTSEQQAEADKAYQNFVNNIDIDQLSVFPNPASDKITVKHATFSDLQSNNTTFSDLQSENNFIITIVDNSGRIVITELLDKNSTEKVISISGLEQGIYFVNLISDNKVVASKSIVIEE